MRQHELDKVVDRGHGEGDGDSSAVGQTRTLSHFADRKVFRPRRPRGLRDVARKSPRTISGQHFAQIFSRNFVEANRQEEGGEQDVARDRVRGGRCDAVRRRGSKTSYFYAD